MTFLLCLIGVSLIWGAVDIATSHYRRVIREQRRVNKRRTHVPYREIGFRARTTNEDLH